jgi:RNA polymerase sigma-70 factor (ECF subfamily)
MQSLGEHDEKELLIRVSKGDQVAFTTLFNHYHNGMGSFIFGITKSKELAEEITSDIFLKIWMSREVLQGVKNFKAYIFIIARNAAITSLRKIIREKNYYKQWKLEQPSHPDDLFKEQKEIYFSLIDEAINQLAPQRKKIYILSRQKGLKYDEIAKQLDISKFTVRAHIQQSVSSITKFVSERISSELILLLLFKII